jgi:hypothetical protein
VIHLRNLVAFFRKQFMLGFHHKNHRVHARRVHALQLFTPANRRELRWITVS